MSIRRASIFAGVTSGWQGFLLGSLVLLIGAAAFDFLDSASKLETSTRVLGSMFYASKLLMFALIAGGLLWLGMRAVQGKSAPEVKESVLWTACLVATAVTAVRMYQ